MQLPWFPSVLCLLWTLPIVLADPVNITIDDHFGDPVTGAQFTYLPAGAWSDVVDNNCSACTAKADPSQAYMATWHDGSFFPLPGVSDFPNTTLSATIQFNGTAVYVYCIVAHSNVSPDGNSDMQFLIDNQYMGSFSLAPTGQVLYSYNVPVFSAIELEPTMHTLQVLNGHPGGLKALTLLDYVTYTHDDGTLSTTTTSSTNMTPTNTTLSTGSSQLNPSPTRTSTGSPQLNPSPTPTPLHTSSHQGLIIGAVVGPIGGIGLLALTLFYFLRMKRRNSQFNSFINMPRRPGLSSDRVGVQGMRSMSSTTVNLGSQPSTRTMGSDSLPLPLSPPYLAHNYETHHHHSFAPPSFSTLYDHQNQPSTSQNIVARSDSAGLPRIHGRWEGGQTSSEPAPAYERIL